jgi:hypothetical protein
MRAHVVYTYITRNMIDNDTVPIRFAVDVSGKSTYFALIIADIRIFLRNC